MKKQSFVEIQYVSKFIDDPNHQNTLNYRELPEEILINTDIEVHELTVTSQNEGVREVYNARVNTKLNFKLHNLRTINLRHQNHILLLFSDSDTFRLQIESRFIEMKKGDFIFLTPSTRFMELCDGGEHLFYFTIAKEYIEMLHSRDGLTGSELPFIGTFLRNIIYNNYDKKQFLWIHNTDCTKETLIYSLINDLISEFKDKKPGYLLFVKGHFYRLLFHLEHNHAFQIEDINLGAESSFSVAHAAKEYLEHIDPNASKVKLGLLFGYDGEYINRLFKQYYHYTIPEYRRKRRLYKAANLLRTTNDSISTICQAVGFQNRTFFYKMFEKEFHCYPKDYRKLGLTESMNWLQISFDNQNQ